MHGIWQNTMKIKKEMQNLNQKEFQEVSDKVQQLRQKLIDQQQQMRNAFIAQDLKEVEKDLKQQLTKWSMIEESIYKQKSKVQWLKLGDSNIKFFFAQIKERKVQNQITMLT